MDKNVFHDTNTGTPQGGIISPLLANIALDGLEAGLGVRYRKRKSQTASSGLRLVVNDYAPKDSNQLGSHNFVRYADDFIILCDSHSDSNSKEDAILAKIQVQSILFERGLELSEEKTKIRSVEDGFDFLGCNIRSCLGNYNVIWTVN